jgi:hypothetical protein
MRCPPLTSTSPQAFFLCSDGSFTSFHPENDQVWELNLQSTKVFPFSLETTYGLRARSMRLFPNIMIENKRLDNPKEFYCQPTVTRYTPDTLRVICQPRSGIAVQYNFFLPTSDVLTGSIIVKNNKNRVLNLTFEMAALLVPMCKGFPMRPERKGIIQVITGQTEDICPVLIFSGGATATANPYPTLSTSLHIKPDKDETLTWALVSKTDPEASFKAARNYITPNWQKVSQQHLMKHNSETLHIQTGQPDWDAAFYLSQTIAMTHWVSKASETSTSFFLRNRCPNQPPYAPDERRTLDNLTTLEATHLAQVLLPTRPQLIRKVIENFIDRCEANGQLPSRMNISNFIKPFHEPPMLAHLTLMHYQREEDKTFLARVLDELCRLTDAWLQETDSGDQQCLPTWQDPQQLQLDTGLFAFDTWGETGKGLNIRDAQSPALLAMLYRECAAIEKIARILDRTSLQSKFDQRAAFLKKELAKSWQDQWSRYAYMDFQSRLNPTDKLIYKGVIKKKFQLDKHFKIPQRLQLHLYAADEHTRVCILQLEGQDANGKSISEKFRSQDIQWVLSTAHITTKKLYGSIKSIAIQGMKPEDHFRIETADFSQGDITCLLPLWAGAADKGAANAILEAHLNPKAIRNTYGIPETWEEDQPLSESLPLRVNVLWNTLIIEGLLREGYQEEAAALFTRLMSTIVKGLQDYHGFFTSYDSVTGKPAGKRNALAGLLPLRLFLEIAGIRLFSPERVAIWGQSPFPWPVKVSWQGLSLERERANTCITFPDGTLYKTNSTETVMISPQGC